MNFFLLFIVALFGVAFSGPVPEWDDEDIDDEPISQPEPQFSWLGHHGPYFPSYGIEDYDDDNGGLQLWGFGPNIFESFTRLQTLMKRLHGILNSMNNGTAFADLPSDYHNSTFTTQIINGSIVTVNSTIKKHDGNNTGYIFIHKVVQIRPQNDTLPAGEVSTVASSNANPNVPTESSTVVTERELSTEGPAVPSNPNPSSNSIPRIAK